MDLRVEDLFAGYSPASLDLLEDALLPSAWASRRRTIVDERGVLVAYGFLGREYLRAIHDDLGPRIVVEKGTQVGLSETALNRAFHALAARNLDVLYAMPTDGDVRDFSAGRFARTLETSPALAHLFRATDNVHHKRAGQANLYLRGAQSEAGLTSIPVALVILDEYDLMADRSVELASQRLGGQARWTRIDISKPSLPGLGIDAAFLASDRRRWRVPCARCSSGEPLRFPDSLDGDLMASASEVAWRCLACGSRWTEEQKRDAVDRGWWEPDRPSAELRGYHVPQLLSPVRTAADHARRWREAQGRPEAVAEFWRSCAAEPYVPAGVRIDDGMVEDAFRAGLSESAPGPPRGVPVTFGVDVGVNHHFVEVSSWAGDGFKNVLLARVVRNFDEIYDLVRRFRPRSIVVDANPNTEAARAFQNRLGNSVWLAFYAKGMLEAIRWHPENGTVSINRTEILDKVVSRFMARRVGVPRDAPAEYMPHHRALQRVVQMNEAKGNEEARYESSGADHFAHAAAYNEVAGTSLPEEDPGRDWPQDRADALSTRGETRKIEKALVADEGWPQDLSGDLT